MTRRTVFFWLITAMATASAGCSHAAPQPAPAESQTQTPAVYKLSGVVKAVDNNGHRLTVQHGNIPGFMSAMTMPYKVAPSEDINKVTPGDEIDADIVVGNGDAHLANIKVTGHEDGSDKAK